MNEHKTAVIVEDDAFIAEYFEALLVSRGYHVAGIAMSEQAAISLILSAKPQVVLMDVRLEDGGDGVAVAKAVNANLTNMRIIFITGSTELSTYKRIQTADPYCILIKPINPDDLFEALP